MFVCHVALQGCLRLSNVSYGLTADTGGHIKYLLELVKASAADPKVDRIDIVTRGFVDEKLGDDYSPGRIEKSGRVRLVRLANDDTRYLSKERLHEQHAALNAAFLSYLQSLDRLPDVVHAHYADAGILARHAKEELGIPYVFTGHSLGAVKKALGNTDDQTLNRRIAIEERVLQTANAVIASSRDEAEAQYAHYDGIDTGRIRVIPPGCDLAPFEGAAVSGKVRGDVERFLREPERPMVLAIARPVRKKNLLGLIEAYGSNTKLRETANLVIVAGCRHRLSELEDECREVIEELIAAVDRHDLYGKVAYPKSHKVDDIPAYYALARETGGVFVNPALNEPFGLTLLEAAAARLPVVATDSGGPNDIVERCKNGLLVCPTDSAAIGNACLELITDRRKWVRYASAGGDAVAAFDWSAHCRAYHRLLRDLIRPVSAAPKWDRLLVCDIDNTLLGDRDALREFLDWQRANSEAMALGIATGRSFNSAQAILAAEGVPTPDVIISSVGAEIHWYDRMRRCFVGDDHWNERILRGWDRGAVERAAGAAGLRQQALLEQKPGKSSFFGRRAASNDLEQALIKGSVKADVVHSHDRYVDVMPKGVNKGAAVAHVADELGILNARVIVAGDSRNDVGMLRSCAHPIIVGNWSDGVGRDPSLSHAYVAKASHAAGILEGIRHYEKANSW